MSKTNEIILELRSISFGYRNVTNFNISANDRQSSIDNKVLDNISINVRQAEIYGLLGESGCGKTTLLRLILGLMLPTSGEVYLFGKKINLKNKPVPQNIGYMPQDIVLYHEFNSIEMLQYFGRLHQMSALEIARRTDQLLKLLELNSSTNRTKLIKHLSGGQKRRISLAIALLHEPALLILDEPTVGLDPILREVIWKHLNYLTRKNKNTILLTTHYIEESRSAQMIGFLRHGRMLVQDDPKRLLEHFKVNTMEEVFLKLCRNDDERRRAERRKNGNDIKIEIIKNKPKWPAEPLLTGSVNDDDRITTAKESWRKKFYLGKINEPNVNMYSLINEAPTLATIEGIVNSRSSSNNKIHPTVANIDKIGLTSANHFICWPHLLTLVQKNSQQVYRNWSLLLFFILLPAIEMALIMLCIGREINYIPIAIYNAEKPKPDLSQVFLDSFPKDAFILHHFNSPQKAYNAVKANQAAAVIQFSEHFSNALRSRFFSFGFIDETNSSEVIWNDSSVYVQLDMSNQLIGLQIQRQLLTAFLNFAQRLAVSLGLSKQAFRPPIEFGPPVYGIQTSAVVETFIAPGALIMIAFFATTIVTCHLLIHEIRKELIERALIAGATTAEFIFSHIIIQSIILLIQLLLVFITAFHFFHMPYLGSLPLSISLICLQGLCGLMYGLMLSATCPDEIYATTLAIGTFFPSVIIGGIFWPVQSMPIILQYVSQCLPSTQSIDALRSILLRNWNLSNNSVATAFAVSTIWLLIFLFCALHSFKRRV